MAKQHEKRVTLSNLAINNTVVVADIVFMRKRFSPLLVKLYLLFFSFTTREFPAILISNIPTDYCLHLLLFILYTHTQTYTHRDEREIERMKTKTKYAAIVTEQFCVFFDIWRWKRIFQCTIKFEKKNASISNLMNECAFILFESCNLPLTVSYDQMKRL